MRLSATGVKPDCRSRAPLPRAATRPRRYDRAVHGVGECQGGDTDA